MSMTLLEMHCYEAFEGIDGIEDEESENLVMLPYVITIDYDSEKIVAIRRNWDENDEDKKRRDWFVSYKFLPGLGFYGFGLYHMIGGLGRAATGSLRALLDSAAFANMQGGFKLKGRVSGGEIDVNPGEFVDLDATVDDVNKAIMPLPFKEPSQSLFNLLGFIVQAGQRFASTSDLNVGDVNPNAPVGSTVALIEQGSKAFSAIHKRLHYSQGQEFKLLAKLNAEHLEESFQFSVAGSSETVFAADFDDRVDIIPVSDPNIFSTAQRIAQAQAILQMAQSAPQLHDLYEAYKRMYEAIRIPNIDEISDQARRSSEDRPNRREHVDHVWQANQGFPRARSRSPHCGAHSIHARSVFGWQPSSPDDAANIDRPHCRARRVVVSPADGSQHQHATPTIAQPQRSEVCFERHRSRDGHAHIATRSPSGRCSSPDATDQSSSSSRATRPRESFGIRQAARTAGGSGSSTAHSIRDRRRPSQSKIRHRDRSGQGSPEHGHPSCQGSSRVGGQGSKAPSGVAA